MPGHHWLRAGTPEEPLSVALDPGRKRQESSCLRAWRARDAWPHVSAWIKARSAIGPCCLALPFLWTWEEGPGLCNEPSCQILPHHLQSHWPSLGPLGEEKIKDAECVHPKTCSTFGNKILQSFWHSGMVLPQMLQMQRERKMAERIQLLMEECTKGQATELEKKGGENEQNLWLSPWHAAQEVGRDSVSMETEHHN